MRKPHSASLTGRKPDAGSENHPEYAENTQMW